MRNVTATKNGAVQVLEADVDYRISGNVLRLTQAGLEKFRHSGEYVEFSVTLSDNSVYTLVIDYI